MGHCPYDIQTYPAQIPSAKEKAGTDLPRIAKGKGEFGGGILVLSCGYRVVSQKVLNQYGVVNTIDEKKPLKQPFGQYFTAYH